MRFLATGALGWLLLGGVIIFFYLLKLRRKRRIVPSTLLWQRAMEEIEANAPFRKLRRSLLLLLQLLALAAVVFALARPLVKTRALATGNTVIVIDSTASMSASDEEGRTRLDRAKEIAREMIDGLSGGDRAAVIESSSRVIVRSPLTSDRSALRSATDAIAETDAAGSLSDALQLAEQMAKAERDTGIVVIGDGGGSSSGARSKEKSPVATRFVRVGRRSENIGIVAMNSRESLRGTRELFASVANFSEEDKSVGVELRIDGNLIDARTISVSHSDRVSLIFDALPEKGGLAELRLTAEDDLKSDNIAYTNLADARRLKVGLASENPFLIRALGVNSAIDARRVDEAGDISDLDCLVVEGDLRQGIIESRKPTLAINPSDVEGMWQIASTRERPEITSFDRSHAVNFFLSYADLHIESMAVRSVAPFLKPIVSSAGDGLLFAGEDSGRRVVMIAIDLSKSDLPLKVEFPILVANSIAWLAGRDLAADERAIRAGQAVTIHSPAAQAIITTPEGETIETSANDSLAVFADTMRAGLYQVKDSAPFAVSLLSEPESDTTPRDTIQTRAGEIGGQSESFTSEREIWRWIAFFALTVLALEWWVYHRRIAS